MAMATLVGMETLDLNRFSSLVLRNKRTLKNRVVVPPMASGTAGAMGEVTEKTIEHYAKLARSGAGLIIAEYTNVHGSGRSEENQLSAATDLDIAGLARLRSTLQDGGALAGLQLTHGGGKSNLSLTDGNLMGPSGITVPVKDETLETPRGMNRDDIELWKNSFIAAARRATLAGFDLIEFHSAHGYGLNQFLSPLTNRRTDEYGGSLLNRSRLLREIIHLVRAEQPAMLISVRIPGQDFLEAGLSTDEMIEIALMLEALGVDMIHVSSGIGGWRRPTTRVGEGYLVKEAAEIQARLSIPVIGVGGIETAEYIDQSLRERKFSLAAVGRAILRGPELWRAENLWQAGDSLDGGVSSLLRTVCH